jgi:hypothetical protein
MKTQRNTRKEATMRITIPRSLSLLVKKVVADEKARMAQSRPLTDEEIAFAKEFNS